MHMSPNEALKTPAKRFFAVLKSVKQTHKKDRYHFLHELLSIVHAPEQKPKYTDQLRKSFRDMFVDKKNLKVMSVDEQMRHNRGVASRLQMIVPQGVH